MKHIIGTKLHHCLSAEAIDLWNNLNVSVVTLRVWKKKLGELDYKTSRLICNGLSAD